jgi:hypothetical protein
VNAAFREVIGFSKLIFLYSIRVLSVQKVATCGDNCIKLIDMEGWKEVHFRELCRPKIEECRGFGFDVDASA